MKPRHLTRNVIAALIGAQAPLAFAQAVEAPATVAAPPNGEPAQSTPEKTVLEKMVVYGNSVGMRQTRANVKITSADLDYYPPGVSADKVLERVSGIQQGSSNAFGGDGFDSTITMRGFAKDNIGFTIDGIPNGRTTLGGGSVPTRFFDSSNLAGVDVSQSAGIVGTPSHQALVGTVNYLTEDPETRLAGRLELVRATADFASAYARIDTGELAPGITSYVSFSKQQSRVSYVDDPSGINARDHVDLKVKAKLDHGVVVKLRSAYNNRTDDSSANIVTLTQFNTNPKQDGFTDKWAGNAAVDKNFRGLQGNPRKDTLTDLQANVPLGDGLTMDAKVYYHTQTGIGRSTAQGNAGYPGMDGLATSLYFRGNNYDMVRRGALAELAGKQSDLIDWRVGAWVERYDRRQLRNWYAIVPESAGPDYSPTPTSTNEDKRWVNNIKTVYLANRSSFLDNRLKLDYGFSVIDDQVDFNAPIFDSKTARFNFVNQASQNSGLLPKIGALYALTNDTELFAGLARNAATFADATLGDGSAASLSQAVTLTKMDSAQSFDVGVRHKGQDYAVGAQAFFIKSDETVASVIPNTFQTENVLQGRQIAGMELTYSAKLGEDWRLYSALTLQSHRYVLDGVDANGNPAKGFIRDGADLVGIARQNLFVEATWRPTEECKLGMNMRYTSSRAGYYANPRVAGAVGVDETLPAFTVFGLNGSYRFGKASVGINIENLTNTTYISGIAPETMTSPSTVGRYFIGAPRTLAIWFKLDI